MAFFREYGEAKIGIQLAHAGRKASDHLPWEEHGRPLTPAEGAWTTVGPSRCAMGTPGRRPKPWTWPGLEAVKLAFVQATRRAARLDFDLVELHAAHGYLLHEFLSPLSNKRTDDYGGSRENRMRFPLEVFEAMRAVWPGVKAAGGADFGHGLRRGRAGRSSDSLVFAAELQQRGCDYLDVSGGGLVPWQRLAVGPGYQVPFAAQIKQAVGLATMTVGMINQPRQAEEIIATGQADLVALARGMLYDPRWAWHAAQELWVDLEYPPPYRRCHPSRWPQAFPHRQAVE